MNRRVVGRTDRGATLIIVLIIVTVVTTVMGVVLSQNATSVRTTVVLRDQASANYAAVTAGLTAEAVLRRRAVAGLASTRAS